MLKRFSAGLHSESIRSIEFLRGIAACMVCYFHLSRGNRDFLPDTSLVRQAGTWGWAGVEVFFVISGFIIPYAMYRQHYESKNFMLFLKKRLIRIEPPYLLSVVLVVVLNFISTLSPYYRGKPFELDWANIASHIAYLNIFNGENWLSPVYWSLAIELQYYLLIALFYKMVVSSQIWRRITFFGFFLALAFIPMPVNKWILTYAFYFVPGIALFQYYSGIIKGIELLIWLVISAALAAVRFDYSMTILIFATILAMMSIKKIPNVFRFLGLISYSLYLIHVPVGGRIINMAEVKLSAVWAKELTVFLSFAFCLLFAYLFYLVIETTFKKMASSITYNRSAEIDAAAILSEESALPR